jgi:hypothetical protein
LYGRVNHIALFGLLLTLGLAAPAQAAGVDVTSAGTISGPAGVGEKLTVSNGSWTGPGGTTIGRKWMRCDSSATLNCAFIDNATTQQYTLTTADKGKWLRVALYAYYGWTLDYAFTNPTGAVAAAPTPTPTPTRTPTPAPTKTPTPVKTPTPTPTPSKTTTPVTSPTPTATPVPAVAPEDGFDLVEAPPAGTPPAGDPVAEPVAQPSPAAIQDAKRSAAKAKKAKAKMIRPYPMVRISGRLTKTGADVALLTVRAPRGVRITLTCTGKACPLREVAQATSLFHIQQFERELRAGTKLTIEITKPKHISKVTTIVIRKGKGPARRDKCRLPGEAKLIACPKR